MSIEFLRQRVNKIKSQYDLARSQLCNETVNLQKVEQHLEDIKEAQHKTQLVAQTIQQQVHTKIARVVTPCLRSVFSDMDYKFELRFERKRNRTEARPVLIKDGHEILNPYDRSETDNKSSESGGVLDVAGFVCQVAAITLHKPALRSIMILDEPFKNLSVKYRDNAKQMVERLSKDFGFQFLIVTHQTELMIGKVVEL